MFNSERFNFKILSVHRLSLASSERYSPPREYNALIFRIRGRATVTWEGGQIRLDKNDVTFVPCGSGYNIKSYADEDAIVIHFAGSFENTPPLSNMTSTNPETFIKLFDSLLTTWNRKPTGFVYRMDSIFLSILEQIERQSLSLSDSTADLLIRRAVERMHQGFSVPEFSIASLAEESGFSVSYFRRVFLEKMGVSPKEYLTSLRIQHAVALLESGYYTVERVAELSGYNSAKHFSTSLKSITGKSPRSFLGDKK